MNYFFSAVDSCQNSVKIQVLNLSIEQSSRRGIVAPPKLSILKLIKHVFAIAAPT